ncbi:hypothetical protein [Sphingobacterium faecale]|uniref:Auto-transporter adhesin head GIN domain-containing protein n=1 Tax=Sphingobacterium faecale TaxID=2803775 RepID=A0ABS1R902_9SPHI|nr:hypothetical protein [Sphingobacterium faecale]MBL1411178.1 hypothetical protein [Sphingobacterium faecale]
MKKSNIILLLSIAFAITYFFCPAVFGIISVDYQGNPTDPISRFWLNLYPNNINLNGEKIIKHIKIIGCKESTASLEIKKAGEHLLKSDDQQNFEYKLHKDTLEIQLKKGDTYLYLEQPMPIQSISCTDHANLKLIPVQPTTDSLQQLNITLADKSVLRMGEYTKKHGNGIINGSYGPIKIKNLKLNLSHQSKAYLNGIQADECTAELTDAFLNCQQSTYIDSLKIYLNGKSSIKNAYLATDSRWIANAKPSNEPNIGHLIVSGNMTYFNKNFIRPHTHITTR